MRCTYLSRSQDLPPPLANLRLTSRLLCTRRGWVQTVMLEVRASNHGAQQLYEQLGFEEVGLRRKYYPNGEDAILMDLYLNLYIGEDA
jgi:ribosomal-protein-alanine N-acetyltransferase